MKDKTVVYKSIQKAVCSESREEVEKGSLDGLTWVAVYYPSLGMLTNLVECGFVSWSFEWTELQKQGVGGFTGTISVKYHKNAASLAKSFTFDVNLTRCAQTIFKRLGTVSDIVHQNGSSSINITYEFSLTSYRLSTRALPIDQIFISSVDTDVVLVVEGRKVHVNKSFLSLHSDFFRSLFSSNFKEGSLEEIPIEEVKYDDFCRLLAMIQPKPLLPTDESLESLLKLAEYFQTPFVFSIVELHLLGASDFDFFQTLFISDKYNMKKAIDKCVGMISTLDHTKRIKKFPEFANLSHVTKSEILDRLMQVV